MDTPTISPRHAAAVTKLVRTLLAQVGDQAIVSPRQPIQITPASLAVPDIAVLVPGDYIHRYPTAADTLIAVAIAPTPEQVAWYAASSVPELWAVDIDARYIAQHTVPNSAHGRYQLVSRSTYLISLALGISIDTRDILP